MAHVIWLVYCSFLVLLFQQRTQAFSSSYYGKWKQNKSSFKCFSSTGTGDEGIDANIPVNRTKKVKGAKRKPKEPETLNLLDDEEIRLDGATIIVEETKGNKKAATKKASRKTRKKKDEISHWLDESDPLQIEYGNSNSAQGVSLLRFKIRGNPRPLRRHRTSFGRMYNPSEGLQNSFRDNVRQLIFSNTKLKEPLFDSDETLVMTIIFRLKRPNKDFVGGKPGLDRMRPNAPSQMAQTRTDVDNLVKFVFDSMNTILYEDDRQIMSVHVIKVLDNEGMCKGSTEVQLQSVTEQDVGNLMTNSFTITGHGGEF